MNFLATAHVAPCLMVLTEVPQERAEQPPAAQTTVVTIPLLVYKRLQQPAAAYRR